MDQVCDRPLDSAACEGFGLVADGLDAVFAAGVAPVSGRDAVAWFSTVEALARRFEAVKVDLVEAVAAGGLFADDGHFSAKNMARHVANLSPGEATARERLRRMLTALPDVGRRLRTGAIGVDQVRLLAKVFSNKRVRDQMADAQDWFIDCAETMPFRDFKAVIGQWERLVDVDGAGDGAERDHDRRDYRLLQDALGTAWSTSGNCGSLQGAVMAQILDRYIEAEYHHDWDTARAEHGDAACDAHLPRTAAQRRADAVFQLFLDAQAGRLGESGVNITTDIVFDADTYFAMLDALDTGTTPDIDPHTARCETIDGVALDLREATAASLAGHVRRVIVDAAGVTIDLGRRQRLFTGETRLATQLANRSCVWPGCHRPTTRCEVDHLDDWQHGGRTDPGNGAPLCGSHNRLKQRGFNLTRDQHGFTLTRPDGSIVA